MGVKREHWYRVQNVTLKHMLFLTACLQRSAGLGRCFCAMNVRSWWRFVKQWSRVTSSLHHHPSWSTPDPPISPCHSICLTSKMEGKKDFYCWYPFWWNNVTKFKPPQNCDDKDDDKEKKIVTIRMMMILKMMLIRIMITWWNFWDCYWITDNNGKEEAVVVVVIFVVTAAVTIKRCWSWTWLLPALMTTVMVNSEDGDSTVDSDRHNDNDFWSDHIHFFSKVLYILNFDKYFNT
jgi:hypothetical protein